MNIIVRGKGKAQTLLTAEGAEKCEREETILL